MFHFGSRSLKSLATCDSRLVEIAQIVIADYDFTVLEGFRSNEAQEAAFASGCSLSRAGQSKHNVWPSRAFDLAPYPINWHDIVRFCKLAGYVFRAAEKIGVELKWGGFWPTLFDGGHFELED